MQRSPYIARLAELARAARQALDQPAAGELDPGTLDSSTRARLRDELERIEELDPVWRILDELDGLFGWDRAVAGGPKLRAWIDRMLGLDISDPEQRQAHLPQALHVLSRMQHIESCWGASAIVTLEVLGLLPDITRYLSNCGVPAGLFDQAGGRVPGLCRLVGLSEDATGKVRRACQFLLLLQPQSATAVLERLARGLTLTRLDILRRLIPVTAEPGEVTSLLNRLAHLPVRDLRQTARVLLATGEVTVAVAPSVSAAAA